MARLVGFGGGAIVLGPDGSGPPPTDDTTPDAFTFDAQTSVALGSVRTSNPITVLGIDAAAPISVDNGEYSISDGPFTSLPGFVSANDTVRARGTASALPDTLGTTSVNIGGVIGIFSYTTAGDEPVFIGANVLDMLLIANVPILDVDFAPFFSGAGLSFYVSGELPDGLSMDSDGTLTGIPLETGTFAALTVVAHNAGGDVPSNEFSITVPTRTPRSRRMS